MPHQTQGPRDAVLPGGSVTPSSLPVCMQGTMIRFDGKVSATARHALPARRCQVLLLTIAEGMVHLAVLLQTETIVPFSIFRHSSCLGELSRAPEQRGATCLHGSLWRVWTPAKLAAIVVCFALVDALTSLSFQRGRLLAWQGQTVLLKDCEVRY